jgi:hypothetical protein
MGLVQKIKDFSEEYCIGITMTLLVASMNASTYGITRWELRDKPPSAAYAKLEEFKDYDFAKIMTIGMYMAAKEKLVGFENTIDVPGHYIAPTKTIK